MGGRCSSAGKGSGSSNPYSNRGEDDWRRNVQKKQQQHAKMTMTPPSPRVQDGREGEEMEKQEKEESPKNHLVEDRFSGYSSSEDEFYDGIPRYKSSRSLVQRSRSLKVSEVLGRAGSVGLERAAEVLDTLGNGMAKTTGFLSSATSKTSQLSILAFEIANTIVKGSNLMQSLSKRSIRQLKEVVFPSDGVQLLVSQDMDELLKIFSDEKRAELKVFAGEIVRFGNQSKDAQWHNLDLFFQKCSRERTQKQTRDEAEMVMQQLMILVQYTAELYQELHNLDMLEEDNALKRQEYDKSNATQKGDNPRIIAAEIKNRKKLVRNLKKKSLWSRSLEQVMEKLVDAVLFLNREINNTFSSPDDDTLEKGSSGTQQRLGPAGLALHYANIILQIDAIVAKSRSMPPSARDTLYQSLPPNMKSSLRSNLQSFHVKEELTIPEIKAEMEKTLCWLVPMATNTAKAHHGFGWVGEWANAGSDLGRRYVVSLDIIQIETLHHADRLKTEGCILELLLWLNHLVKKSKAGTDDGATKPIVNSPTGSPLQDRTVPEKPASVASPTAKITPHETKV